MESERWNRDGCMPVVVAVSDVRSKFRTGVTAFSQTNMLAYRIHVGGACMGYFVIVCVAGSVVYNWRV